MMLLPRREDTARVTNGERLGNGTERAGQSSLTRDVVVAPYPDATFSYESVSHAQPYK